MSKNDLYEYNAKQLQRLIDTGGIDFSRIDISSEEFCCFQDFLLKNGLVDDFWTAYILNMNEIDEMVIAYLFSKNICLDVLSHANIPSIWLFMLGNENVEAFQTLMIRFYTPGTKIYGQEKYNSQEFKSFLSIVRSFGMQKWVYEPCICDWLMQLEPDIPEKRTELLKFMDITK